VPNGGSDNCGNCRFNHANQWDGPEDTHRRVVDEESFCTIRGVAIKNPWWTYCANAHSKSASPEGPIYAAGLGTTRSVSTRIPWHGPHEPGLARGHGFCSVCRRRFREPDARQEAEKTQKPAESSHDVTHSDDMAALLAELIEEDTGSEPAIEIRLDDQQTLQFCCDDHYVQWWQSQHPGESLNGDWIRKPGHEGDSVSGQVEVSLVCGGCGEHARNPMSGQPLQSGLAGFDGVEWARDGVAQVGDIWPRLEEPPVVGQQYALHVGHPFRASVDRPFWALFRPAPSALNWWLEYPSDLQLSSLVQCHLLAVLRRTAESAWIRVRVLDRIGLPEIARRFTVPEIDQDSTEFYRGRPSVQWENLTYVEAGVEGDVGTWMISQTIGQGSHKILCGEWGWHENYFSVGSREDEPSPYGRPLRVGVIARFRSSEVNFDKALGAGRDRIMEYFSDALDGLRVGHVEELRSLGLFSAIKERIGVDVDIGSWDAVPAHALPVLLEIIGGIVPKTQGVRNLLDDLCDMCRSALADGCAIGFMLAD